MRIQHNIMAMGAYRNYTNNVNAMKKNLEKLSSGYKINRAGDDAAGLAISEKMRAQITGLETAQKNAKDGISLVQTAEGALTEVHDMLNRMVTLATQSANGTYDNETDRAQLQKELDQLRTEINRIADSSNFNGIKLLNGDLDGGVSVTAGKFEFLENASGALDTGMLPKVGTTLTTSTILHNDGSDSAHGTTFSVDLHDVGYNQNNDNDFEIKIGGSKVTFKIDKSADGTSGVAWSSQDIANAFVNTVNGSSVTVGGNTITTGITLNGSKSDGTAQAAAGDGTLLINGQKFKVELSGEGDDRLLFTQIDPPSDPAGSDAVKGEMSVSVTSAIVSGTAKAADSFTAGPTTTGSTVTLGGDILSQTIDWTTGSANLNSIADGSTVTATIDGKTYTVTLIDTNSGNTASGNTQVGYLKGATGDPAQLLQDITDAIQAQMDADDATAKTGTSNYNKYENFSFGTPTNGTLAAMGAKVDITPQEYSAGTGNPEKNSGQAVASYNWQTTDPHNVTAGDSARLASTKFKLTGDMTVDGNYVTIGNDRYTFTTDKANDGKDGYVYINKDDGTLADVNTIAQRLSDAAGKNKTYTVGAQAGSSEISLVEIEGQKNFNLTTEDGILKSLGFGKATQGKGKSLMLQIGESADDYNKLEVNVRDMHTASLGIADLSISTQDGAAAAIDKIKAAINMVSDVRGTLGATQNRLDHTINNLSVMQENIQDAESTIRDTDVAAEMMEYTKNNILIQSAQAMLAQANQVPQGVLQLLQ